MTNFTTLGLAAPLLKALEGEGYTTPTPIQARAIPHVLAGKDLLGIAQTGTGKTAAFALPILHRLAENRRPAPRKGCRVLVLSPTRELASQIAESFRTYGRHVGISVAVVFGGVGHRPQIDALAKGVDVLVATPGRLLDHMGGRAVTLDSTEIFVLDEADQMLDLGFVKPIRQIVARMSTRRQSLFFSATMPKEIAGLANELLRDPEKVSVAPAATTVERIEQRVIHVAHSRKRAMLTELLADASIQRALVFTRTKRGADRVAAHLEDAGITVAAIHGNKSQGQREKALGQFRSARVRVLVATDIAARGLDIDHVSHVVNYEMPEVAEAYVHRIGRTARAGAGGTAISLCDPDERDLLRAIERLARITIPVEQRPAKEGEALAEAVTREASAAAPRERGTGQGRGRGSERGRAEGRGPGRSDNRGESRNSGRSFAGVGGEARSEARGAEPRTGHRDGWRPEAPRAEGARSQAPRAEGARSQAPRAEGARSQAPRADGARSQAPRAEGARSQAPRAEGARSQAPRADGARSQAPRADGARYRDQRPAGSRSDAGRSGGATSSGARSGQHREGASSTVGRGGRGDASFSGMPFLTPGRQGDGDAPGRNRARGQARDQRR